MFLLTELVVIYASPCKLVETGAKKDDVNAADEGDVRDYLDCIRRKFNGRLFCNKPAMLSCKPKGYTVNSDGTISKTAKKPEST